MTTTSKKPESPDVEIQQVTIDLEKPKNKAESQKKDPEKSDKPDPAIAQIPKPAEEQPKEPTFSPEMVAMVHNLVFGMVSNFTNDPIWNLSPDESAILGKLGAKVADKYIGDSLGENSEEVVYAVSLLTVIGGRLMKNGNKPKTQDSTGSMAGGNVQQLTADDARLHPGQEPNSKGSGEVAGSSHKMVLPTEGSTQ